MLEMKDRRPDFSEIDLLVPIVPDSCCRTPGAYSVDTV
jgi:hypothetical protein